MYQQVTIIGNLGTDPDMRFTPAGMPVTSFSVACNRSWIDAEGVRKEKVVWFRITCWRKLAELAGEYLAKGRQVLVVGELEEARPWTDKQGNNRASLEVTAQTLKFLSPKGEHTASDAPDLVALPAEVPF